MASTPYRNSKQREKVYQAVVMSQDHPSAESVYQALRVSDPTISLGTVYRNLDILCKLGRLSRVGRSDGPEAFDADASPHYHLLCSMCGAVEDVDIGYAQGLDEAAARLGLHVDGHRVLFDGLCHRCAHQSPSS